MQDRNAQKLIDMLVYSFDLSANSVFSEHSLQQAWSTKGSPQALSRALLTAEQMGWVKQNLECWQLTALGAEAAGK